MANVTRAQKREYDRKRYEQNRDRIRAQVRESQARYRARMSPEERWARRLWHRHRMTPAQWHGMYEEQGGKCYLCLRRLAAGPDGIDIDHDHSHCGADRTCSLCRRGLACHDCNAAIGFFGDSAERLRTAAENLARAQAVTRALIMSAPQQESLF